MKNCVFCNIIERKIPADIVYENSKVIAILDAYPANPGHTLVIPKNHYETMVEVPDPIIVEISKVIKELSKAVLEATGAKGFNIFQNNGKVAGQVVDHAHFHIVPRFKDDGLIVGFRVKEPYEFQDKYKYEEGEARKIRQNIRSALAE